MFPSWAGGSGQELVNLSRVGGVLSRELLLKVRIYLLIEVDQ
jgi:hypothetical protein